MALAAARNTPQWGAVKAVLDDLDIQQAANKIIYQGGIVAVSAGFGQPATAALGLIAAGIAFLDPNTGSSDSTGLAAGALTIRVRQGTFRVLNSASTDAIAQADQFKPCYLVDDQTVAKTNGAGTRSFAGIIMFVDTSGVWVFFSAQLSRSQAAGGVGGEPALLAGAGAVPLAPNVLATITGTTAYTLANGTTVGQKVAVTVSSASSGTPAGTITPATARGFTSVSALGATGDFVEFMWTATGWIVLGSNGVTIT